MQKKAATTNWIGNIYTEESETINTYAHWYSIFSSALYNAAQPLRSQLTRLRRLIE